MNKKIITFTILLTILLVSCDLTSISSIPSSTSSSSSSTTSISTPSVPQGSLPWELVWHDEFDYTGLPDSTKWGYDVGGGGWGNNELQYYTNADLDNARVGEGNLTITARREAMGNREYTSARLVTRNKADFLYGRMEARAKIPSGLGTWPAIWMLPTDWVYGGWPTSGEIDIMEHVGYDPHMVHASIHTDTYNHTKGTQLSERMRLSDVFNTFHRYAVEWEPGVIRAYINDTQYATFAFDVDDVKDGPTHLAWPFDQEFHFILNIAVGGSWGGVQGVNANAFPTSMVVDYIRVFQKPYGASDLIAPTAIDDPFIQQATGHSLALSWAPALDNRKVKNYMVRVNDVIEATPSVPAVYLSDLSPETTYDISIVAVDFNQNMSESVTFTASTEGYPTINEKIEAENYINQAGVRFETTTDVGGGTNAGWLDVGDYLEYKVDIPNSGNYRLDARVAGESTSGQLALLANNELKASLDIPITGAWQNWQTVSSSTYQLQEGLNTIRLRVDRSGFNLNYFQITSV